MVTNLVLIFCFSTDFLFLLRGVSDSLGANSNEVCCVCGAILINLSNKICVTKSLKSGIFGQKYQVKKQTIAQKSGTVGKLEPKLGLSL